MILSHSEIRSDAYKMLSGHWHRAAMFVFVYWLMNNSLSALSNLPLLWVRPLVGLCMIAFLPITWALDVAFLRFVRTGADTFAIGNLFIGFKDFKRVFLTMLLVGIYTALRSWLMAVFVILISFLYACFPTFFVSASWMVIIFLGLLACIIILSVVIVASLPYTFTSYVLADNADLSYNKAIDMSKMLVKGHKLQLFAMAWTFVVWHILAIFTLGIFYCRVIAYMRTSYALYYERVKSDYDRCTD